MLNKLIIGGYLTRDPELRYTPQGTPVFTVSIANNRIYKRDGQQVKETTFLEAVGFGTRFQNLASILKKGKGVILIGRLKQRSWEKDGVRKSKFEMDLQEVEFLPRSGGSSGSSHSDAGEEAISEEVTDLEPF